MWVSHVIEWPRFLQTPRRQSRERICQFRLHSTAWAHLAPTPMRWQQSLNLNVFTWKSGCSFLLRKQHQPPGLPVFFLDHVSFLNSLVSIEITATSSLAVAPAGIAGSTGSGLGSLSVHQWRVWKWTHADFRQLIKLAFYYLSAYFLYNVTATVFISWSAKSFFFVVINYPQDDMAQCRKTRKHE